jgi:hypothetical protein
MIEVAVTVQAAPVLLQLIERIADALDDLVRLQSDALSRAHVPETPNFAGTPEPARAEPAGSMQASVDVFPPTAQPAGERNKVARPAAASSGGGVWTPERTALLRKEYGRTKRRVLFDHLNRLPGKPIASEMGLATKARDLGLQQPRGAERNGSGPSAGAPGPVSPTLVAVQADFETVMRWALTVGVSVASPRELPGVNKLREKAGLPPFQLISGRARAA